MRKLIDDILIRNIVQEDEGKSTGDDKISGSVVGVEGEEDKKREEIRGDVKERFREASINTADPISLLLICYDLAKSSIRKAIEGINKKDYEMKYEGVSRALKVFDVLMAVTEPNEVGRNLIKSYLFITKEITEADIKKDVSLFEKVISHIEELEKAWEVVRKNIGASQLGISAQSGVSAITPDEKTKTENK